MRMKNVLFVILALMTTAPALYAQSVVNPTKIQFTVSVDNNATLPDGTAKIASYSLETVTSNAGNALAFSQGLGKPTPDAQGNVTIVIPGFLTLADGSYIARVYAIGPGGQSDPAVSDPFVKVGRPAAPGRVILIR